LESRHNPASPARRRGSRARSPRLRRNRSSSPPSTCSRPPRWGIRPVPREWHRHTRPRRGDSIRGRCLRWRPGSRRPRPRLRGGGSRTDSSGSLCEAYPNRSSSGGGRCTGGTSGRGPTSSRWIRRSPRGSAGRRGPRRGRRCGCSGGRCNRWTERCHRNRRRGGCGSTTHLQRSRWVPRGTRSWQSRGFGTPRRGGGH